MRVDNIKMDFRDMDCGGIDWIDPAQVKDQWRGCTTGGFSRRAQLHTVTGEMTALRLYDCGLTKHWFAERWRFA
jgi:hypothetical protein